MPHSLRNQQVAGSNSAVGSTRSSFQINGLRRGRATPRTSRRAPSDSNSVAAAANGRGRGRNFGVPSAAMTADAPASPRIRSAKNRLAGHDTVAVLISRPSLVPSSRRGSVAECARSRKSGSVSGYENRMAGQAAWSPPAPFHDDHHHASLTPTT